jgi:hypothetical protein
VRTGFDISSFFKEKAVCSKAGTVLPLSISPKSPPLEADGHSELPLASAAKSAPGAVAVF